MPNYNDRRYDAENARREAHEIHQRYGLSPRTMPHIAALTEYAERLDNMNTMEVEHGPRNESPEMRRRRDSRGRYMEGNEGPHMEYDNYPRSNYDRRIEYEPQHTAVMSRTGPAYYPYPMHPSMNKGGSEYSGSQIGFASGSGKKDRMHDKDNLFEGMERYLDDFLYHKQLADQTNDPTEKQHAALEAEEFWGLFEKLYQKVAERMNTPEEKQKMAIMLQRMQQMR